MPLHLQKSTRLYRTPEVGETVATADGCIDGTKATIGLAGLTDNRPTFAEL